VAHDPRVQDVNLQLDIALRLLIASALGAAIGLEREVHGHPAGMRTHLLVSLGSALFTALSIYGFEATATGPIDPSRVAAQIVSGIGFLGAGAIIKDGFSVRGLTTAASLWATAAVGMGAGTGEHIIAAVGAGIIVFSLWPLSTVADRIHGRSKELRVIRLGLTDLSSIADVSRLLTEAQLEILSVETAPEDGESYAVTIGVRVRSNARLVESMTRIQALASVQWVESEGRGGD
jgi:putative Mg2+ transporter-C (MgtC) family protein